MYGRMPKKSNNTKYYEVLGVSKTATQDELKKRTVKLPLKTTLIRVETLRSLKNWLKLTRFLMILKRGKSMTNMARMHSKKEWEEAAAVISIVPSIYLSKFFRIVVALGVEDTDKSVAKMWYIL